MRMKMKLVRLSGDHAEPPILMEVNTTPLIDVMLVLLVMLIITIPTRFHAISLDMGKGLPADIPVIHTVSIDFDGRISWDDKALSGQAALNAKLREVGTIAADDQPELHIRPNKLVDYNAVAAVMAAAQRSGVVKMGILGSEQFLN